MTTQNTESLSWHYNQVWLCVICEQLIWYTGTSLQNQIYCSPTNFLETANVWKREVWGRAHKINVDACKC
jgi:hypothetical protein